MNLDFKRRKDNIMNYKIGFVLVLFIILTCCSCGPMKEMTDTSSDIAAGTTSSAVTAAAMDSGTLGYTLQETSLELKEWSLICPQFTGMEEKKQERLNDLLQKQMLKWLQKSDFDHGMPLHMDYTIKYQAPHFISLLMEPTSDTSGGTVVSSGAFTINLNLSDELVLSRNSLCWDRQKLLSMLPEQEGWILPEEGGMISSEEGGCPEQIKDEIEEGSFWEKTWKKTEVYFTEDQIGLVFPLDTDSHIPERGLDIQGERQDEDNQEYIYPSTAIYELADEKEAANLYFPRNISWSGVEEGTKYWGEFQFDSEIQKDVYLKLDDQPLFTEEESGEIFLTEFMTQEEQIPLELLDQGVLYVTPDHIYRMREFSYTQYYDDLIEEGKLPGQEQILCQRQEKQDTDPEEAGQHWYIRRAGDEIRFFSYDNTNPQGKYEMFVWKRLFGLTAYRCGFGTEGDCIRIRKKDLVSQESVLEQDIFVPAQETEVSEEQDMDVKVHNPWFPYEGGEEIPFAGNFYVENRASLQMRCRTLGASEKGTLYELLYNQKNDYISGNDEFDVYDQVSPRGQYEITQGHSLGYFWVTEDKIYQTYYLSPQQREVLLEQGEIPDSAFVVCQEEEMPDKRKGEGDHISIAKYEGDIRCFCSYYENSNQEGREIYRLVWKKNVGLVGWSYMRTSASADAEVLWQEKYLKTEDRFWFTFRQGD